jgi:glutaminyl-peptide cyclotransferase
MNLQVRSVIAAIFIFGACSPGKKNEGLENVIIPYSVLAVFPHDKTAFIEGLVVDHGKLYESTGEDNGWIAEVDIASGAQQKKVILEKKYFGEGITILNNKVFHLTYKTQIGFVYDLKTFKKIKEFSYPFEGWGMTHDGKNLIVSDGTQKLHFLDTANLTETSVVEVHDANGPVKNINELEYIDGYLLANQWQTDYILKIDPASGEVLGTIDLSPIAEKIRSVSPRADVLNGIAYEKQTKMILITGKFWPSLYAIKLK